MATKIQVASWIKKIDKHITKVALERDKLDETISTLDDLKESCRRAHDSLQDARDALSELA